MGTPTAIRLVNVNKSFRNGRDHILRGINLDFPEGKLTYVLGPSGTGKSVTIKHILGLLQPDSGEVLVFGKDISKATPRELPKHRMQFGMLFQNSALFDDMTIFDNVAFPLREHTQMTEEEIRQKVEGALVHLGLSQGFDKFPNELSGGMKKRAALARAIIREPRVLLYDEPTTGLDPVTRLMVDELIAQLKSELKLTSIVISHDIPSALHLADQIAFLYQGQVVYCGDSDGFKKAAHPEIQRFLNAERHSLSVL